ncbi:MAG: hypothetical protein U0931_29795 [Vulcanimicrobiota bacterium]
MAIGVIINGPIGKRGPVNTDAPINSLTTRVAKSSGNGLGGALCDGFVLDTNSNGKYERGLDPVLAFDFNHDGRIDNAEVDRSSRVLNAASNPTTPDGKPNYYYTQAQEMGLTGGDLTAEQLARAGARVVTDTGFGDVNIWSTASVYNFPMGNGQRGSLESVNPNGGFVTPGKVW